MIELVFLGTSSATPTPRRNVSSIAVQLERESLLVDVGEGTQQQILRSGIRRGRIDRILITHLHGDHFYGLIGLLTSFQLNRREEPLQLIGPPGLERYISFMKELSQTAFAYDLEILELAGLKEPVRVVETRDNEIWAGPLRHRLTTIGYRIVEKDRFGRFDAEAADRLGVPFGPERKRLLKGEDLQLADGRLVRAADLVGPARRGATVAICTDTCRCPEAVALARGADLLVHESTFDPSEEANARRTRHSTTADAVATAKEAGARQLVLTHFSTRYMGDLRPIRDSARALFPGAICARDFLQVRVYPDRPMELADSRRQASHSADEQAERTED
jgi:ribonuclease Z